MKKGAGTKAEAPKPPSPRERVDMSAEHLARDLTEAHPEVQKIRTSIERRLRSAMDGVVRGLNGAGKRGKRRTAQRRRSR